MSASEVKDADPNGRLTRDALALVGELEKLFAERMVSADVAVLAMCWVVADLILLAERERGVSREHANQTIVTQLGMCVDTLAKMLNQQIM